MACSSGDATVSEIVFGFAPGYDARTTMVGGTTSGYSLIGNRHIAIMPTRKIPAESTPAKIGRRMKKCANFISFPFLPSLLSPGDFRFFIAGDSQLRFHGHAGAHSLQ